ncbi:ADP-ribosylglycohydrolase family protein [Endozoicomonas sp. 8E]|uniref:ADP-ribosylglycohydrolase family protein n=1 Tax=Endozoicomonas sp. 8E TaxID=3035692 RepID=UPI0029394827|nr:ADP-ribosylglycohydrolase family protein [Endozoicomonas sp. 8E]WOG28776.1 ADP-ribosylglycohydrolase family protein [Endozoicomonas sp. 8E]
MNERQRAYESVIGALVADAAAMGFHWLYDQALIAKYGGENPEFHTPVRAEYEDKGYFAHEGKQAGEFSHYGAQLLSMQDAIIANGHYSELGYIESFQKWFDFGGQWQGYTDHPTRETLLTLHQRKSREEPLSACGADDTQNPALSKLPPLISAHGQDQDLMEKVESAVRVTNNSDVAVSYARAVATMIKSAHKCHSPELCVEQAKEVSVDIAKAINIAESMLSRRPKEVAQEVGMHCGLDASFIVITHLLLQAENYEKTVRENIYCGGDSCGRAIPLGAILSACFFGSDKAMPTSWIARTSLPGSVVLPECGAG